MSGSSGNRGEDMTDVSRSDEEHRERFIRAALVRVQVQPVERGRETPEAVVTDGGESLVTHPVNYLWLGS